MGLVPKGLTQRGEGTAPKLLEMVGGCIVVTPKEGQGCRSLLSGAARARHKRSRGLWVSPYCQGEVPGKGSIPDSIRMVPAWISLRPSYLGLCWNGTAYGYFVQT